ncbi:hypothetical protein WICMUC_000192, partial [Wickerhamomyces mucosus]
MVAQSYINVDSTLSEAVQELGLVIDHFNPELQYVEKLNTFVKSDNQDEDEDDEDLEYVDELYNEISKSFQYFKSIPDKEFESLINLIIYILTFSGNFNNLIQFFLKSSIESIENDLNLSIKKQNSKLISIISNYSNVFNLSSDDDLKNSLLLEILSIITKLKNSNLLKPILSIKISNLINNKDIDKSRLILLKLSELTSSIDEIASINYLKYSIVEFSNPSQDLIDLFLIKNLNSTKIIDLSYIQDLKNLSSSPYLQLINDYISLNAIEFQSKIKSYNSLSSLNFDNIIYKNQIKTFLIKSNGIKLFKFEEISKLLSIPSSNVEIFLINIIKLKLIVGKIDQINQIFKIYKINVNYEKIELKDWLEIKSNLLKWRENLKEVKNLIDQAQKKKKISIVNHIAFLAQSAESNLAP